MGKETRFQNFLWLKFDDLNTVIRVEPRSEVHFDTHAIPADDSHKFDI